MKILFLLIPIFLVQAQTVYVRAHYNRILPGMATAYLAHEKDLFGKGYAALLADNPHHLGGAALRRVFPAGEKIEHDVLHLSFSGQPPILGGSTPQALLQALGYSSGSEYSQKLATLRRRMQDEIWTANYRHGQIQQGDYVTVYFRHPPMGKAGDYVDLLNEYEKDIAASRVQIGEFTSIQNFRLWSTPEEAPYTFVSLVSSRTPEQIFQAPPRNRIDGFRSLFPAKSYSRYLEKYNGTNVVVDRIVYRVVEAHFR